MASFARVLKPGGALAVTVAQPPDVQPFWAFLSELAEGKDVGWAVGGRVAVWAGSGRSRKAAATAGETGRGLRSHCHRRVAVVDAGLPPPAPARPAEICPSAASAPQEAPYPSQYDPCRFGDPQPLLDAAAAAGLGSIACRPLLLEYRMEAGSWWRGLSQMPDAPIAVRWGGSI